MLSNTCRCVFKCLAFVAFTALASDAHAGFSNVKAPGSTSELDHGQILSQAYGGGFTANGMDFSNGSLTAKRMEDNSDQCWGNAIISARAIARFAGFEQSLGIIEGESGGGTFQHLFSVTGQGMNVAGSIDGLNLSGTVFRFARGGGGELCTSMDLDNVAAADQMVSYHLSGPGGLNKFLLFFEDATAMQDSDWDFNDLVVEISMVGVNAVPLPPAVWSGLAVLLTGGFWNARARLRAWFR